LGLLILAFGIVLAFVGGQKIARNFPVSEETVLEEARRALSGQQQGSEIPPGPSVDDSVEIQIWMSALEMRNEARTASRTEGIVFFLTGVIAILWGITILYNSRSSPAS
jgi:hypothetical protein